MKIALLSAEYPHGEIPSAGIGTYTSEMAFALAQKQHCVEVFCGSFLGNGEERPFINLTIHKIFLGNKNSFDFRNELVNTFTKRHEEVKFDVVESPEYGADGLEIKKKFPELPMVVKLHTPLFLAKVYESIDIQKNSFFGLKSHIRKSQLFPGKEYNKLTDPEYHLVRLADKVYSPSKSLTKHIRAYWNFTNIKVIPNLFNPSREVLNIKSRSTESKFVVSFLGSLCKRKGIDIFLKVIPKVLKNYPEVEFRFIGRDNWGKLYNTTIEQFFYNKLNSYKNNIRFYGEVSHSSIPYYLEKTDLCIFPSIWENFPYVCLEAMSAGRAVIGSVDTGMEEMLENGGGKLINPENSKEIADAIIYFILNRDEAKICGEIGRVEVLSKYNPDRIIAMVESLYTNAIEG